MQLALQWQLDGGMRWVLEDWDLQYLAELIFNSIIILCRKPHHTAVVVSFLDCSGLFSKVKQPCKSYPASRTRKLLRELTKSISFSSYQQGFQLVALFNVDWR